MDPRTNKKLHKSYKRMIWFICGFFLFAMVIAYLLHLAGLNEILIGFIIICLASVFYLLFLFVCAKIDKKKEGQAKEKSKRDPFTH